MDIVTTPGFTQDKLTAEWFAKHNIYDTENRTKLINMAEKVDKVKKNENVATYASLLRLAYKQDMFHFDAKWNSKVTGALQYFHQAVIAGTSPEVAYATAKKEYGINEVFNPTLADVKNSKYDNNTENPSGGMDIGNDVLLKLIKQYESNHK